MSYPCLQLILVSNAHTRGFLEILSNDIICRRAIENNFQVFQVT